MKKYKVIAVSQLLTLKSLVERATEQLNEYAEKGWEVVQMRHGWSGFFFSSLYILLEKKSEGKEKDDAPIIHELDEKQTDYAVYNEIQIFQYDNKKIIVKKEGKKVKKVLPELRIIAENLLFAY